MTNILVVEDEAQIARFLTLELEHENYSAESVGDGLEAVERALAKDYDLIILDIMLPSINGLEALRRIRQHKRTPVLILTARDQVIDKVTGLDVGADDYMTKPFAIEELLARIRVILKRGAAAAQETPESELRIGKLIIQTDKHSVTWADESVTLTRKEYDLLCYLVENKNKVLSREKILDKVWGYDYYGDTNVVDVYVRYLRGKIDEKYNVKLIQTLRGTGYIVKDD
ncbi:MAG: response regulator transcription factor [Firmicutes bacterium]|nr:response regulator transcription factor [Bacillota bacterium]